MCVLRASGSDFDVSAFLTSSSIQPCKVYRRGEPRLAASQPQGPKHEHSGFHADVSTREWDDLPGQIDDAKTFLAERRIDLLRLRATPGVTDLEIDFPIHLRIGTNDIAVQSDSFPPDLLLAAGSLGIAVTFTIWPPPDGPEGDGTG
jgi:hypothetical protein